MYQHTSNPRGCSSTQNEHTRKQINWENNCKVIVGDALNPDCIYYIQNNWHLSNSWTWRRNLIPCSKQLYNNIVSIRPKNCICSHGGVSKAYNMVKDFIMDTFGKGPWKLLLEISLHSSKNKKDLGYKHIYITRRILNIDVLCPKL